MINVTLANAGYGKTTKLVERAACLYNAEKDQFAIAFTNNAVTIIDQRIKILNLTNLKCCTIHSFLYEEIIKKYSPSVLNMTFYGISSEKLDNDYKYKNAKLRKINNQNLIHVTQIPKKAKMIIDNKPEIFETFKCWLEFVIIDEAQDLDSDMIKVFDALSKYVNVSAVGDLKQDLKGSGEFKEYCESLSEIVIKNETYRLKENHVQLVNSFVMQNNRHISKKEGGEIGVYLESDIKNIQKFLNFYDLAYISKSTGEYYTNSKFDKVYPQVRDLFERIMNEYKIIYDPYEIAEILEEFVLDMLEGSYVNIREIIKECGLCEIPLNIQNGIIAEILKIIPSSKNVQKYKVSSIHSVKGDEANNCLFIINNEMAETILQNDQTIKKMNNLLYVGLTRSLFILEFLILDKQVSRSNELYETLSKFITE